MAAGRLAKAGCGELAVPLPAGYARRPSGEVALDPDEQVQAVIRLVFRLFDELGTVHAVLRFLVEHQVRIGMRERSGPGKGEVAWRAPHQQGLVNLLRNPAYAGIYAYGRSRTDPSRRLPGREHSGRVRRLEAGQWLVRIEGALPAYISVEQYERNLARLAANRARAEAAGAPRNGPALLGGLVACGICGQRLQANYEASGRGLTGRYCCQRRHHTYGEPRCQQMAAPFLDDHVVAQVLSALAPAALELSVTAAAQVEDRRAEAGRIWRQRLERADFACDRARRQYQLAEPENRLVARQLEREWEAALAERAHLGEEYERYQRARPARLSAAELAAIRALAGDIPALWAAPTTTAADRKRLLRAVIESVQVTADGATERVHAAITWAGGHQTHADLRRPVARIDQLSYYPALTERIRALAGAGPGQRRDRRPAGRRGLPHAPPARTLPSRRDPAADPPAGPAPRPGPRPPHRPGQPRAWPVVAGCPGPRDRHAGGDPVRMAQTRLDHRPPGHPAALPVDHHRRPRRGRAPPRSAPAAGRLPQPAQLD